MPSFSALPVELFSFIYSDLSLRDHVALSSTSKDLLRLTTPRLYHTVTLTTHKDSTAQSFILAAAKYGKFVRSLRIIVPTACCDAVDCNRCEGHSQVNEKPLWSSSAGKPALCLLGAEYDNLLPHMYHLAIEFPSRYGKHYRLMADIQCFGPDWDRDHGSDMIKQARGWFTIKQRNLKRIASVFARLSLRRDQSNITHLSIANVPMCKPNEIVASRPKNFRAFLGSLKRFDLSLWTGGRCDAGSDDFPARQYDNRWEYSTFVESLPGLFFDHLASVTTIRFEASFHGAIGQIALGKTTRKLPLVGKKSPADTMPLLEKLELVKVMVDSTLLEFLETRTGKAPLELSLENTWVYEAEPATTRHDSYGPWAEVLDMINAMITRENGPKLKSFRLIRHANYPLWFSRMYSISWCGEGKMKDFHLTLFQYACLRWNDSTLCIGTPDWT